MIRTIDISKWFNKDMEPIQCGIELELLLFDARNKEPLNNNALVEKILSNLPDRVYKDFYSYQLEIRTQPHTKPTDLINETLELYRMAYKEFIKHRIYIIPAPSIVRSGYTHCGLHAHISYPKHRKPDAYWMKAMGMYPFVLSLADHTKNFELDEIRVSDRLEKSRHIGLPELLKPKFIDENYDNRKFRDIIYSRPITNNENRSRMKKPATIEIRLIDTPSLLNFYEFIIHFIFNLASRIREDNPMINYINKQFDETVNKLTMTRRLLIDQRYGVNKIFRMLNSDIVEQLSEEFKLTYPRETQFEFREKMGLSADVNGYLSMATKGGWL